MSCLTSSNLNRVEVPKGLGFWRLHVLPDFFELEQGRGAKGVRPRDLCTI